jgi:tetratricopeptide (TPR) repeat protein
MIKIYFLPIVVLLISGCAHVKENVPMQHENVVMAQPSSAQKSFAQEDLYILFALESERIRDYYSAYELYLKLYKNSKKREYLYKMLDMLLAQKAYEKVYSTVAKEIRIKPNDIQLQRYRVLALYFMKKYQEAISYALDLAKRSKNSKDHLLVADIYYKAKESPKAITYLKHAYKEEFNEDIAIELATMLYMNREQVEAIKLLKHHIQLHGCSQKVCKKLLYFYSKEKNIDGLLMVYKHLYEKFKEDSTAQRIIEIYNYKKEYFKLIDFLEANRIDDDLLLNIYISVKDYKKASELAMRLYKESEDVKYLGEAALFSYEAQEKPLDKKRVQKIVKQLQKVLTQSREALYLNYLGYILIDHNIDVQKGMKYIEEALKENPDSAYYLDSLAWGYYKLGNCKKADTIMQKVIDLGEGEIPEVKEHIISIKKCLKKSK